MTFNIKSDSLLIRKENTIISENITKIVKAYSCPNCGGPLNPPTQYIKPDEICSHCKQSIIWARTYLALLKNELKHETNETLPGF